MDEKTFAENIMALVTDNMIDVEEDERTYDRADSIISIADSGYVTRDEGLVVSMEDGTEFMVIVKQVR